MNELHDREVKRRGGLVPSSEVNENEPEKEPVDGGDFGVEKDAFAAGMEGGDMGVEGGQRVSKLSSCAMEGGTFQCRTAHAHLGQHNFRLEQSP